MHGGNRHAGQGRGSAAARGEFRLAQVDLDEPRADEILVRVAAVGLCHTDIAAQQGGFGFDRAAVLGHEGAGLVVAVGSAVTRISPGDRVAISFRSCGDCSNCRSQQPAYCHQLSLMNFAGRRVDGSHALHEEGVDLVSNFFGQSSFASHALTYQRDVVKLPDDIPFAIAAPMGCGIQTGAGSILRVLRPDARSSLLVTGGGAVGLSAVMAAQIAGTGSVIVVEPHPARRDLAMDLGATHVIDPLKTGDLAKAIRAIAPDGIDLALDTTGRDDVLAAIMAAPSRRSGRHAAGPRHARPARPRQRGHA